MERKRLTHSIALAVLFALAARAAPAEPDLWFPVGERLTYQLYWGIIPVGSLKVASEWVEQDGRKLLALRARARSNAFLDKLWRVDDYMESLVDPEGFVPVKFIKNTHEGRRIMEEVTVFDRERLLGLWERKKTQDGQVVVSSEQYPIEPDTRDLLAHLYWARKFTYNVGDTRSFRVMTDEKIYDLWVTAEKKEKVSTPQHGEVRTIKFAPEAALEKVFVRKGKLWLWVSDDDRRIFVRAAADVIAPLPVKAKAVISDVLGPGDDRWVKPQK